MKRKMIIKKK